MSDDKEKKNRDKKEKNPPAKEKDTEKPKPNSKTDKSKNKNKKSDGKKKKDIGERPSPEGQSGENDEKNKKDESKEEDYEEKEWNTMKPTGTVVEAKKVVMEEQVKILYEAMKGFGTDEDAIIKVLSSCSNAQRQNLKKTYKKKYKKELTSELKGEVSGDFEEVVLSLMMTPQEFEVERLHRSMAGLGTDERLLLYVIIMNSASPQGLKALIKKYKDTHKKELSKAVMSETSGLLQKVLLNLLGGKRSQSTQVKDKYVDEAANKLHGDGENAFKYDVEYCADLLTSLNTSQAKAVFAKYREVSGESVTVSIEKHTAGVPELSLLAVARYLMSPYAYMAHVLHEATAGTGTNDSLLMAVIVGRSEIDLVNVKMAYKDIFGKNLEDVVQSECSGDYRKLLLALLTQDQGQS